MNCQDHKAKAGRPVCSWRPLVPLLCLLLFWALGSFQLHLPGLHYDEAREAGLNAMQLVTGQPLTAFREATVRLGPWQLPLMVQDYIGALNVLLAVPFLAVGGIDVVALRWLPLLTGGLTLLLAWKVADRLGGRLAAGVTTVLLAVNPAFVFWSRQGIFVTNITALFWLASLFSGLRWWSHRRPLDLWLTAFLWGLGLYAKLLFVWAIGATVAVAAGAALLRWLAQRRAGQPAPVDRRILPVTWLLAAVAFLLPLIPLLLFNARTGGTLASLFGNLDQSYYGVDNSAYLHNLVVRLGQVRTLLRGDHLWYLGGIYANAAAPWLAGGLVALAVGAQVAGRQGHRRACSPATWLPCALVTLLVAQSAFTVSDLFITHYALLLPLLPLVGGGAAAALLTHRRLWLTALVLLALLGWGAGDLWTTIRYHRALTVSGGYSSHSDAIANLAGYVDEERPATVIALDWGMDAQLRFLTAGRVNPLELFGYTRLDVPDDGFVERVRPWLDVPDAWYLAHSAEDTVFRGRVEMLTALAAERGAVLCEQARFSERSGRPLFLVYQVLGPEECR